MLRPLHFLTSPISCFLQSTITGRLHGTIVGPTGRSDWSVRPVGRSLGRADQSVRRSYHVNAQLACPCPSSTHSLTPLHSTEISSVTQFCYLPVPSFAIVCRPTLSTRSGLCLVLPSDDYYLALSLFNSLNDLTANIINNRVSPFLQLAESSACPAVRRSR